MSLPLPGDDRQPSLADFVMSVRKRRALSTRQAAKRAAVAGHSLSAASFVKIEGGSRDNPNLRTLQAIADALNVEIEIRPGRPMRMTDLDRRR